MESYTYKDLPITPGIIETITVELFNGKTIKRDEIINKVLDYHVSKGGLQPIAQDFPRSIKTALSSLKEKGNAVNKSHGFWHISKSDSPTVIPDETEENVRGPIDEISTQTVYGKGPFAVYLYYFPSYKDLATFQGKKTWPCKIGRTDQDPLARVLSQVSTALPEKPYIEFIVKTKNSSQLEKMIQSVLTLREKQIEESPGTEWYNKNPDEVLEIIKFVNANIL